MFRHRLILMAAWACLALALPSVAQPAPILIERVTLIDGTGRPAIPEAWVLTEGDRIVRVARRAVTADGATRIDGRGKFLIPGLADVHIHLSGGRGPGGPDAGVGLRALHGFLYSGFTTVYDAGNNPDHTLGLRARERDGDIVSPRIFATGGMVTVPGGHGGRPGATLVDSWPEAIPALDAHIAREPDLVKLTFDEHGWGTRPLIPLLPVDLMRKVGAYFNEHGIRTTVHISHEYRARQAIDAGINTLAHPVIQGPVSEGFVELMATTKTPMVSTLTIGEGYSRLVEHPEFRSTAVPGRPRARAHRAAAHPDTRPVRGSGMDHLDEGHDPGRPGEPAADQRGRRHHRPGLGSIERSSLTP